MTMPGFSADGSLGRARAHHHHPRRRRSGAGGVVAAIPFCDNCDEILDRCADNGFRPRAVCRACWYGNCYSGVENPPPNDPWTPGRGHW